jgi:hypothetical protein
MAHTENQKFEAAWREAFRDAEQDPTEQVWMGVEHALDAAEAGNMKRRVVFYQRLAAAAVLFALVLGGITTWYVLDREKNQELLTTRQQPGGINSNENKINPDVVNEAGKENSMRSPSGRSLADESNAQSLRHGNHTILKEAPPVLIAKEQDNDENALANAESQNGVMKRNPVPEFSSHLTSITSPEARVNSKMREVTIARKLPAMPASFMAESRTKKDSRENLWASVGASMGNYSPSGGFSSSALRSADALNFSGSNQLATSTSKNRGSMVSVGMNMGKRIANHWVVQGGLTYFTQSLDYTSNYAMVGANNRIAPSVVEYSSFKSQTVVPTATPYQVNSVNQFVSVPLQAGYLIVDKKVGLQVNSGVATDFFFQNTLSDESGRLANYSSGPGEDSPYRTVSWAGLMGTEVSYKIGTQYRFSLTPGMRYSINSVLKSDNYNPLVWDVGFRFRYIIK